MKTSAKVVEGVKAGMKNKDIAEELQVHRNTVSYHLAKLREGLQARSPEDFAEFVRRQVDLLTSLVEQVHKGQLGSDAANSMRGLMDSIAKLTGSNAPTKHLTKRVGADEPLYLEFKRATMGLSEDEVREALSQLAKMPRTQTERNGDWFPKKKEIEQ